MQLMIHRQFWLKLSLAFRYEVAQTCYETMNKVKSFPGFLVIRLRFGIMSMAL